MSKLQEETIDKLMILNKDLNRISEESINTNYKLIGRCRKLLDGWKAEVRLNVFFLFGGLTLGILIAILWGI